MGFWYLSKTNFNLEKEKFNRAVQKHKEGKLDINELSLKLELLLKSKYLSDSLVEDLIWIVSQGRIREETSIQSIVLAFMSRAESITNISLIVSIDGIDHDKKIRQFNSLIRIAVSKIQDIYPLEFPSFTTCLKFLLLFHLPLIFAVTHIFASDQR